jgi:hypothetical protein
MDAYTFADGTPVKLPAGVGVFKAVQKLNSYEKRGCSQFLHKFSPFRIYFTEQTLAHGAGSFRRTGIYTIDTRTS